MDRHTVIFSLDKRQENLGKLLRGNKLHCKWEEYEAFVEKQRKETLEEIPCENIYVLPITVAKLDKYPEIKRKLKQELTNISKEPKAVCVFGGVFNEEWKTFLEEQKIPYWDFMKLPEVVEGNGWITAEGTVAEVLQLGLRSIWQQNVMVTGYGCCGEKIAKVFSWLGANVTVVARKEKVRGKAEKDGFWAIDFPEMGSFVEGMDTVINTVPAMVVTKDVIQKMRKDTLIIDIASSPGGTDFEAAKDAGIVAKLALGLPGIYTTASSAALLGNAIERYAPVQENMREDRSWIFQIII